MGDHTPRLERPRDRCRGGAGTVDEGDRATGVDRPNQRRQHRFGTRGTPFGGFDTGERITGQINPGGPELEHRRPRQCRHLGHLPERGRHRHRRGLLLVERDLGKLIAGRVDPVTLVTLGGQTRDHRYPGITKLFLVTLELPFERQIGLRLRIPVHIRANILSGNEPWCME